MKLTREQRLIIEGIVFAICLFAVGFACSLAPQLQVSPGPPPTVTPTVTPIPTAASTPTVMPTPRHVALPPAEDLAYMIAAEAGSGFHYLPWHYVSEDSVVWLIFGWPERDDRLYRAVFGVVGGEWALLGVEPVGKETREASVDRLNEQATDFH